MKEYSINNQADFRAYAPLPDLSLPINPIPVDEGVGRFFSNWEQIRTDNGDTIALAPTCEIDPMMLIPDNWSRLTSMGNVRSVMSIDALTDGTNPHLVVKSPERHYSRDPQKLSRGDVWWSGPRSWDKAIDMRSHPAIEAQVEREAIILFALRESGIFAEVPQAIITRRNGTRQLVVREILQSYTDATDGISQSFSQRRAKQFGFITTDVTGGITSIQDTKGNDVIVGVHRWQIPPHTDTYHKNLVAAVAEAAAPVGAMKK